MTHFSQEILRKWKEVVSFKRVFPSKIWFIFTFFKSTKNQCNNLYSDVNKHSIGHRNIPKTLTSTTRLMYFRVYDSPDLSWKSHPSPLSDPSL